MRKKNIGTSFDSWLDEEGIRQEVTAGVIKRVLARQVATAMAQEGLTKTAMARLYADQPQCAEPVAGRRE